MFSTTASANAHERDELLMESGSGAPPPLPSGPSPRSLQRGQACRTLSFWAAGLAAVALLVAFSVLGGPSAVHRVSVSTGASALRLSEEHAQVQSGDTIYLRAHTSKFLEATDGDMEARSKDDDGFQAFTLHRKAGEGRLSTGDVVYLQAHAGGYVTVKGSAISADAEKEGEKEALVVEKLEKTDNGTVHFGDEIYLRAHTDKYIDVHDTVVKAQYSQKGGFQMLVIVQKDFLHSCAKAGENCAHSKCCHEAGMQCYEKDAFWSQCKETCSPGPDPTDQSSYMPWSCKELGERTPGESKKCSAKGEACQHTKCCEDPGMTCFEKSSDWASCKPACEPGLDMTDSDAEPWSCKALGPTTPSAASWVQDHCAAKGADCSKVQCCQTPGHQCYLKGEYWGQCRDKCTPGEKMFAWDEPWNCSALGARTPASTTAVKMPVQPWVVDRCAKSWGECTHSNCCLGVGQSCFKKNENWATCRMDCNSTEGAIEENQTWSCDRLSAPSEGLALIGYPSLYCVSVMRIEGYEPDLLKAQMKVGGGIFGCDGFDVVADGVISLGKLADGTEVKTKDIPPIKVGVSQDGTAANTKLFMKFWDRIIAEHRFNYYDWTVKVDPDAVLLAPRLRAHMAPHVGTNVYVVNCNKFPSSPNFPMMYGALEVFSLHAMQAYAEGSGRCGSSFWPVWQQWGEDYFMTHCMDFLGVGRIGDFGILGDNMCTGANCGDTWTSTFHPFKDIASWMECWGQANPPQGR